MKRHFENLTSKVSRDVQHWWVLMLVGVLCVAAGIAVFVFPLESYVTLSIVVGILMLLTGAGQLVVAATSGNYLAMRGYIVVGGIVDLLFGIFLCIYPGVTLVLLPVMLGLWLLYHSFMIIAFGGDLETFRIKGGGTMIFGGILLLLLALLVLVNPFSVGIEAVIIMTGVGLVLLGLVFCVISVKFKEIDKYFEKEYPR
ncbi:MAG: DUF308 domain-containing protein [Bacteroidales bacterium]|nr:DUF308 domain-containing protein [Bacteroidales bacterium]